MKRPAQGRNENRPIKKIRAAGELLRRSIRSKGTRRKSA